MQTPIFLRASSASARYRSRWFLIPQVSPLGEVQNLCRGSAGVPAGAGELTRTGRRLSRIGLEAAPFRGDFRKVERCFAANKVGRLGEGSDGRFDGSLKWTASFDRRGDRGGAKAGKGKVLGGRCPEGSVHGGL